MAPRRRSSILTDKHRKYLLGEKEPANESEYRQRIQDGLHMSIFDYYLILNEMRIDDIREALSERENSIEDPNITNFDDAEPDVLRKFGTALPSLFALPYISLYREEKKAENQPLGWRLELCIQEGIKRALNRMGESVHQVNVDIDIELGDPLEEVAEGKLTDLDHSTLSQLRRAGHISDDEFAEAWVALKQQDDD